MDKELQSGIEQLNKTMHQMMSSNIRQSENIVSAISILSTQIQEQPIHFDPSPELINEVMGGKSFDRENYDPGGGLHTRFTTPMLPGGFRAFFGTPQIVKEIFSNAVSFGIVDGFKKTFRDRSIKRDIERITTPEARAARQRRIRSAIESGELGNIRAPLKKIQPFIDEIERIKQESGGTIKKIQEDSLKNLMSKSLNISAGLKGGKTKDLLSNLQTALATAEEEGDLSLAAPAIKELANSVDNLRGNNQDLADKLKTVVSLYNRQINKMQTEQRNSNNLINQETEKIAEEEENRDKLNLTLKGGVKIVSSFVAGITLVTAAVLKFRQSLIQTSQQLGGVSLGKAFTERLSATFESLSRILPGGEGFVTGAQILETKGAFAQEFGGLLTTDAAAELAEFATNMGLTTDQLISLERTFQGTTMNVEDALDQFRQVGIGSGIAAQELAQNADIIARAGDNFNSFIVEGIRNAKRLGLEFRQIEQTLTGFSMDFEGTVESFAQTRALIPGMATDFSELMYTSLYGSTDDFIEQIRTSLTGAGITSTAGMSRAALASLEQTTGFSADQIDRILANEDVNFDVQQDLDMNRNKLLVSILTGIGIVSGLISGLMLVTAATAPGPLSKLAATAIALGSVAASAAIGGAIGYGVGSAMTTGDDIVSKPGYGERTLVTPQGPVALNNQDTLIAGTNLYDEGELSAQPQSQPTIDLTRMERKLDEIKMVLQSSKSIRIMGMESALEEFEQHSLRNY